MKWYLVIFAILFCASFMSCRKSARTQRENTSYVETNTTSNRRQSERERPSVREKKKPNNKKLEGKDIFKKYSTAVFMVFTSDGFNGYQGSGFFINSSGLAVSNYHVFQGTNKGAEQIKLVGSDIAYKVTNVLYSSKDYDFILFQTNCTNTNYIPIAQNKPSVGERVFAIGSPRGLENTFSSGEVSQWRDTYLMQISALIDHGSSGGALINEYGEVVGITSGSFYDGSQANLNYAWSIEAIKPHINN